jgi:hypothetical protein
MTLTGRSSSFSIGRGERELVLAIEALARWVLEPEQAQSGRSPVTES